MKEIDAISAVTGKTQEELRELFANIEGIKDIADRIHELAKQTESQEERDTFVSTIVFITLSLFRSRPEILYFIAREYYTTMDDTIKQTMQKQRMMQDDADTKA